MFDDVIQSQPVLILGGGQGGYAFLELFQNESFFHVIGVVDRNADAPAILLAKRLNIKTFSDVETGIHECMPCTAFNLTHDDSVTALAEEAKGACSIIGGLEAKLIWQMVTRLKGACDKLQQSQEFTQSIISNATDGIIMLDENKKITSFNPAAEMIFGYTQEQVNGKKVDFLIPEQLESSRYFGVKGQAQTGTEHEVLATRSNMRTFPMSVAVNDMVFGKKHYFIASVKDITDRKKHELSIQQLAHYDGVTGLANRVLFFDRLKHALAQSKRNKQQLAVLFLDLDGFKAVNDTFGHDIGDKLLKQVARRLVKTIREMDTVSRFGGDEFAFVLNDIDSAENAALVAKKVVTVLGKTFVVQENQCNIGGCVGIALHPDHGSTVASLIKHADLAMYAVKHNGKNGYKFYDPSMER